MGADEIAGLHASRVQARFPQIRGQALKARACMYTVTPDRDFVVDQMDGASNVWIASACSGHGFKHSAGLGEAIAQRLRGGGRSEVLEPFRRRVAVG